MRVELRAEAQADLLSGALFYDRKSVRLGDYFLDSLHSDLEHRERSPGIHELVYGLHRKLATNFPFAIHYLVVDDVVDVVAILDCRENPR